MIVPCTVAVSAVLSADIVRLVRADGIDSDTWGQSQTMRYKHNTSSNLIFKPMTVLLDVYNADIIFLHEDTKDIYRIATY